MPPPRAPRAGKPRGRSPTARRAPSPRTSRLLSGTLITLATTLPTSAGRRAPVRLQERLGRHERQHRREPGGLPDEIEPHAADDRGVQAHRRQREGHREGGGLQQGPEEQGRAQVREEPLPCAPGLAGADGLRRHRLEARGDAHAHHHRREAD